MVYDYNLRRIGVATMTLQEIGFLMLGWLASSIYFYSLGIKTGYLDGRRAVRKQYEMRDKVRA